MADELSKEFDHKQLDRDSKEFSHLIPLTPSEIKRLEALAKDEPKLRKLKEQASEAWRGATTKEAAEAKLTLSELKKEKRMSLDEATKKWRIAAQAGLELYQYGYAPKPEWRQIVDDEAREKIETKREREERTRRHRRKLLERMEREGE